MSQHYFNSGNKLIVAGWDRPLQYLFMTVFNDDEKEIIYSNLSDLDAGITMQSVDHYISKLNEINIQAPDNYWNQISLDAVFNTGNFVKHW